MKIKSNVLILSIIFMMLSLASCKDSYIPPAEPEPSINRVTKIDLTGAKGAVITSRTEIALNNYGKFNPLRYLYPMAYALGDDRPALCKITDEGIFVTAEATDASGDTITIDYEAVGIININSTYSVAFFGPDSVEEVSQAHYIFLINVNTGDAYNVSTEHGMMIKSWLYYENDKYYKTASSTSAYYLVKGLNYREVRKVDLTTRQFSRMSAEADDVMFFDVDNEGNILYKAIDRTITDSETQIGKVATSNGTVFEVPYEFHIIWLSNQNKLQFGVYVADITYTGGARTDIYEVYVDSTADTVSFNYIDVLPNDIDGYMGSSQYIHIDNSSWILSSYGDDVDTYKIYEMNVTGGSPNSFDPSTIGFSRIEVVDADSENFYLSGKDVSGDDKAIKIRKVDVVNDITVLTENKYSMAQIKSNGEAGMLFLGTRKNDGMKVLGEIDSSLTEYVYEEGTDLANAILEKLK